MSEKFYMLNGLNDPNLKHVFLASLPQELQPEIQRMITSTRRDVTQLSLGEFHQMTFAALDKLCEQQSFFKDLMDKKAILKKACSKSHLEIQCKKMCTCPSKLLRIKRRGKTKKKSLRFFRRRPFRKKKTDRCYLCGKKGHFARRCPNKKEKSAKMVSQILQISGTTGDDTDIESLYSEQDEQTEDTVFAIHDITSDEEDEHSSVEEGDDPPSYLPIYMMQANSTVEVTIPAPQVEIQILQSPYDKPIKAIGFIDTGATKTMLNPEVLPDDAWRTHYEYFQAADGQKFSLLSLLRSLLEFGFDLYHKAQKLQVLPTGLKYKRYFQPFSTIPRIFAITDAPAPYADISNKLKQCCADSHADFKHPHPLWKNPEFFIQLPFKLNEDANPIKASHPGMTPDDLVLAREECNQLLALGLIEPTKSNWACPAFYVNKRTEQIRGKKRLVIDYKALNHFLLDDKFPLPKTKVLFSYLAKAQIFSKFDLKSGFWQLGIDPNDRYKTAFCLPNAQYQWTVMPFGLKVAPSLFQKAMIKIFEPILHTTLIYIDDILLYTQDQPTHAKLLQQFYDIVQAHGVMLSDKKSFIGQPNIDFLGMKFIDGRYQPGPHITQELLKFPEENLTTKEIQQFLVYKEILAIKYGIKKFEFHLIGHHFTIMMDNTSFPRIMDLKNKGVPEPQLLRLKDWFSKYQFTVKHIKGDANLIPDFLSRPSGIHLISPTGTIPIFMASSSGSTSRSPSTFPPGFFHDLKNIREYALDNMFRYLARLLSNTDIPPGRGCFRPDHPFFNVITLPGPAWNKQFQQTLDEGKSYSIIILHRPYYEGTGEAKPLPLCRTWKSLEKPLIEQRHEGQELARHLCFVNKIPIPTQGLKLVYTSLAIEPMDEDSDDDPMQEPDSQDPWDYGTEINLESPSFYHGGPSTSA
ncbi:UNVERIFIED_CONTAM: polyprotein [Sesamum radiatum]|uniref:Polyprotein n=1 Tax=Sesamum radiatum TaxID=300843 RepID=A0AAW2JM77_SESRA